MYFPLDYFTVNVWLTTTSPPTKETRWRVASHLDLHLWSQIQFVRGIKLCNVVKPYQSSVFVSLLPYRTRGVKHTHWVSFYRKVISDALVWGSRETALESELLSNKSSLLFLMHRSTFYECVFCFYWTFIHLKVAAVCTYIIPWPESLCNSPECETTK